MVERDVPPVSGGTGPSGEVLRRLTRLGASLQATPAEVVGLALLLAGGLVCFAVLVRWTPAASSAPDAPAVAVPTSHPVDVTVHVVGAVAAPGVVRLTEGARVGDAVAAAGGPTVLADVGALNLARVVADGERVEVPTRPRRGDAGGGGEGDGGAAAGGAFLEDGRLDLNRADAADLETLPGIGPVLAGRIVGHRDAHGPFHDVGQLREVPGIGERTFQALAELVAVR